MRSKFLFFVSLPAFVLCMSRCSNTALLYTTRQQPIERQAIPTSPVIADLNVSATRKIKGLGNFKDKNTDVAIENAKEIAIHDALETNAADVIIDPTFQLTIKTGLYKKTSVEAVVSGYYAVYTNIHKADTNELKALMMYREILNGSYTEDKANTHTKRSLFTLTK